MMFNQQPNSSLKNVNLDDLKSSSDVPFDQFKGKKSTYKDELYTSALDESKITDKMRRHAEKMEKEILNQDSKNNLHLMQERGQAELKDDDKERSKVQ